MQNYIYILLQLFLYSIFTCCAHVEQKAVEHLLQ